MSHQLDQAEMIAVFEELGFTAIPHPYYPGAIAMPLHHKVDAVHLADHHGWEPIPMGWKPKQPVKRASLRGAAK
ncbi:MAG: hypothetical protein ISN29_06650 [Gammaproteobacteria bacterium AqS3]|nr:hypothetical protein [Gammaproteobacteria bacterium AqS3]